MKWVKRMVSKLIRQPPAVSREVARARAVRSIAELKRAGTERLWPRTEQARADLESLIDQALRGH